MPIVEDPLKGLDKATKYVVNMVVEGLAPYFPPEKRQEAVYRLKAGLALVVQVRNLRQQYDSRGETLENLARGMKIAGGVIGDHLLSVIERQDPQELQQYLFEYAQGLTQQQERN